MNESDTIVIIASDWYNAVYCNGVLHREGKPEYLDAETVHNLFRDAAYYWVGQDVYDDVLNGAGYPQNLADFPLARCRRCA